jgi:hypothetical protein
MGETMTDEMRITMPAVAHTGELVAAGARSPASTMRPTVYCPETRVDDCARHHHERGKDP